MEEIEFESEDYPKRLRNIKNPPKRLYVLGNKEILNNKGIAIVGSRDCTQEGKENAKIFARELSKADFTIISGMAKGIDTASHIGALEIKRKNNSCFGEWNKLYISKRK